MKSDPSSSTEDAVFIDDDSSNAADVFVQEFGSLAELDGFPRIVGLFMGLMIISDSPLAFSEIAERLEISRGSVSSTARRLMEAGMILRVRKKGTREHHYKLAGNPYAKYIRTSSKIIERAHQSATIAVKKLDKGPPAVRQRLRELDRYYVERLKSQNALHERLVRLDGGQTSGSDDD